MSNRNGVLLQEELVAAVTHMPQTMCIIRCKHTASIISHVHVTLLSDPGHSRTRATHMEVQSHTTAFTHAYTL